MTGPWDCTVQVCDDCAAKVANDEDPADPDPRAPRPLALVEPGEWLVIDSDASPHFTDLPCATCGTTLAGDRRSGTLTIPGRD